MYLYHLFERVNCFEIGIINRSRSNRIAFQPDGLHRDIGLGRKSKGNTLQVV